MRWPLLGKREESKPAPIKTQNQSEPKAPEPQKPVLSEGGVVATKVLSKARHAFLTRHDGKGEVFLSYDILDAKGIKDLKIGQNFHATWVKNRSKNRFDVTDLKPINSPL